MVLEVKSLGILIEEGSEGKGLYLSCHKGREGE